MALEQEIKLAVLAKNKLDISALACIEEKSMGTVETRQLISRYFDNSDLALLKQGIGLRRRFNGQTWLQTVKETGLANDGLHERQEWEHVLGQDEFEFELLQQTPLIKAIEDESALATLQAIFTIDFSREHRLLKLTDQTHIELAYDFGHVYTASRKTVIHEIELELKSGSVDDVKQFAALLLEQLPLQYSDISKAQRGYQLFIG